MLLLTPAFSRLGDRVRLSDLLIWIIHTRAHIRRRRHWKHITVTSIHRQHFHRISGHVEPVEMRDILIQRWIPVHRHHVYMMNTSNSLLQSTHKRRTKHHGIEKEINRYKQRIKRWNQSSGAAVGIEIGIWWNNLWRGFLCGFWWEEWKWEQQGERGSCIGRKITDFVRGRSGGDLSRPRVERWVMGC